jgi:hypothetical protein
LTRELYLQVQLTHHHHHHQQQQQQQITQSSHSITAQLTHELAYR